MSLLKHLLISVSVAIAVILAGTLWLSINSARDYLQAQLQSQGENAASALALSLSQPANQDPVVQELLMKALFDTGQFRSIRFTDPQGQTLVDLHQAQPVRSARAPQWFERWLPLPVQSSERVVSNGWNQVGQIALRVDSAQAQDTLWQSSVRTLLWVLLAGGVWGLFVALLLNWFRKVLQQEITQQVRAIASPADAQVRHVAPQVAELAQVVQAIEQTRERVRATAQEQNQRIETLEVELNRDPVTLLPNRKYLVNELRRHALQMPASSAYGHVFLLRQRDLQSINAHLSRAQADDWLRTVTQQVQQLLAQAGEPGMLLARLNGSDFVVHMPQVQGPRAMQMVQRIQHTLQSLRLSLGTNLWCRWAYALTDYGPQASVADILARLDQALSHSESSGQEEVEYLTDAHAAHAAGKTHWKQVLDRALSQQQLHLLMSTRIYQGQPERYVLTEGSLELRSDTDGVLQASLFMPVAVRLEMSAALDIRAVELARTWLQAHVDAQLSIKISLPSLATPNFLADLEDLLAAPTEFAWCTRLMIELDAHGLVAMPEELEALAQLGQRYGVQFGLRRLEHSPTGLHVMHTVPWRYLKISAALAQQSLLSPGSLRLLQALHNAARDLQVQVLVADALEVAHAQQLQQQGMYIAQALDTGPRS